MITVPFYRPDTAEVKARHTLELAGKFVLPEYNDDRKIDAELQQFIFAVHEAKLAEEYGTGYAA